MNWRDRLRNAVQRTGMKHSIIALDAGIAPETLRRIVNTKHAQPAFETRATNVSVGWVPDESPRGIKLRECERAVLRAAGMLPVDVLSRRWSASPPETNSDRHITSQ